MPCVHREHHAIEARNLHRLQDVRRPLPSRARVNKFHHCNERHLRIRRFRFQQTDSRFAKISSTVSFWSARICPKASRHAFVPTA